MNEVLVVKIPVKKKGESVHMKKVVAMYEQEEAYGKKSCRICEPQGKYAI